LIPIGPIGRARRRGQRSRRRQSDRQRNQQQKSKSRLNFIYVLFVLVKSEGAAAAARFFSRSQKFVVIFNCASAVRVFFRFFFGVCVRRSN